MDTADPHETDPPLLRDHSVFRSYKTERFEYPQLRIFFRQHVKADEFASPLPLLVFIPGLGGSVAQFHPLLSSLVDLAPCLSLDWPGGGRSRFLPTDWEAYSPSALMDLVRVVVEDHRDSAAGQGVVLIGHSMGTALAAGLASRGTLLAEHVVGVVAICPVVMRRDASSVALARTLLWLLPDWLVDLWRSWDGLGGPHSASVSRFVGRDASLDLRLMQLRFNQQSRTPVWRRMAYGALSTPKGASDHGQDRGLPGLQAWAGVAVPVYLIAGEEDAVTPPSETHAIVQALFGDKGLTCTSSRAVQSIVLPAPANHALLYMPQCARVLAGLVSDFLAASVSHRLSLSWQLQSLSREGKWDVKNLKKWQSVAPVSDAIGPPDSPVFRVTKTLREADDEHSPQRLVERWGGAIKDLVDLSLDQPVYDPRSLEKGGIHYHKFPTVSKVPPEGAQVDAFIRLVDGIRESQRQRAVEEGWEDPRRVVVGVHCHYGSNRSGYFVVCYLVERCGYALPDAIEEFARAKPDGIRHSHFLDKLYMRYNLERRSR